MTQPNEKSVNVFYSWQSDLPDRANSKLIRNALANATAKINADHAVSTHISVDEATRNSAGSPNIVDSIFSKIRGADIFVCDVSKVAEVKNHKGDLRIYCNPNAAIELGYAIRVLGWERIILVFNKGYGNLPDDLPFDIRSQRTMSYKCHAESDPKGKATPKFETEISNSTGSLAKDLEKAIRAVLGKDPLRPEQAEIQDPDTIRRNRDVQQLIGAFRFINVGMLEHFIDETLNGRMPIMAMDFSDFLASYLSRASFHLNDKKMEDLLVSFSKAWSECLKYSDGMDSHPSGKALFFRMPGDAFVSDEQRAHFKFTADAARKLHAILIDLLSYVREHFLEIDLTTSGADEIKKHKQT